MKLGMVLGTFLLIAMVYMTVVPRILKYFRAVVKQTNNSNRINIFSLLIFCCIGFSMVMTSHISHISESKQCILHIEDRENPREWLREKSSKKGIIYDRNGILLAYSKHDDSQTREYPLADTLSHIVGYTMPHRRERSGIENAYVSLLTYGPQNWTRFFSMTYWKNRFWNVRPVGSDVHLTVDARLQRIAVKALANRKGAVLCMNPENGEILCSLSWPAYDPPTLYTVKGWNTVRAENALCNRVYEGLYEPGSIFKIFIAAAGLEHGFRKFDVECRPDGFMPGNAWHAIHDHNSDWHNTIDMAGALKKSCNTYFAQLGVAIGKERLVPWFRKIGFTEKPQISKSKIPSRIYAGSFPAIEMLNENSLAWSSIGQHTIRVTPFQVAQFIAVVANEGRAVPPMLVKDQAAGRHKRVISKRNAKRLLQMLYEVVGDPNIGSAGPRNWEDRKNFGTGWRAKVPNVKIAGKTGTAENPHGKPHAWFAAIAPLERPAFVAVVLIENGGFGGEIAAPIAQQMVEAAVRLGYVKVK